MSLLEEIYPLRLAPVSSDTDRAVEILRAVLPCDVREFPSGTEHNGWIVPDAWEVLRAEIRRDGELIYDGMAHPLGVIGYSRSFSGSVPLEELKRHLFHHPILADARVYHCDLFYKPWREDWGFSMPRTAIEGLSEGTYEVALETSHAPGTMKVCDIFLPGRSEETVLLNAHTCHAGQANDDIAGVVIGVEVMKRLMERDNRLSYRLVLAPEHLGTVFYAGQLSTDQIARLRAGIFLEMLGNDNRLALQESFTGRAAIDRAVRHTFARWHPEAEQFPFRRLVGNDETVWEAPGIEIPMVSLSRFPYVEYHSDRDDAQLIRPERLQESLELVMRVLEILETDASMHRTFDGLIALSNPRYDLYIDSADPSIRPTVPREQQEWKHLMDCLPRYFDGSMSILDVAERHGVDYWDTLDYVRRFETKGLIELEPRPLERPS